MANRKIAARLTLPLPWIRERPTSIETVEVVRGADPSLTYLEDGIVLAVEILNPAGDRRDIVDRAANPAPGTVTLVAGDIPLDLRAELRRANVSFLDVDGSAELFWPRLRISASRLTDEDLRRRTPPVTLRGAHARVVQALLASWLDHDPIDSGSELAARAKASEAAVSRALRKLAEHGLVELTSTGRAHRPELVDPLALADILKSERSWPTRGGYHGYVYGRDTTDRAADLMVHESDSQLDAELALTGMAAAAQHGVLTTGAAPTLKMWLRCDPSTVPLALRNLRIEPVPPEEANVILALDRYRIGTLGRRRVGTPPIWTSHPIRIWCDLHSEPRGDDLAAQLWHAVT